MTIERSTTNDTVIVVKVTPQTSVQATAGLVVTDLSFTITWPSSYTVDLDLPTLSSTYGIVAKGPKYTTGPSGVNFRSFGLTTPYVVPADWTVGAALTVMTIKPIQNVAVPANGNFSLNPFGTTLTPIPSAILAVDPYIAIDDSANGLFNEYEGNVMGPATAVVLPLELLNFDAKAGKDAIDLRWKTAKEDNFRGFGIERSVDGKKFETIGFEAGKNAKGADYTYSDRTAAKGIVYYYRLRMVDNDGKGTASDIRFAKLDASIVSNSGVSIYPNPSNGDVNLDFTLEQDAHTVVDLFDVAGKNVLHKEVAAKKDRNVITLEMLDMPSGVYSVRINMGGKVMNKLVRIAK